MCEGAKHSVKFAQSVAAVREEAFLFVKESLQHADIMRWFCRVLDWAAKSVWLG